MPKPNIKTTAKGCLTLTAAFILIWAIGFYTFRTVDFHNWKTGRSKASIQRLEKLPNSFPILIITKDTHGNPKAEILTSRELERHDFEYGHNYTYLVPKGQETRLNHQLKTRRNEWLGKNFPGSFTVKRLPNGKQYIRTTTSDPHMDGRNYASGWYIAHAKTITPKYISTTSYGGVADLGVAIVTFLPSLALTFIAASLRHLYRKRRTPAQTKE